MKSFFCPIKISRIKIFSLILPVIILLFSKPAICQDFGSDIFKSEPHYEIPFGIIIGSVFLDHTVQKIARQNTNRTNDKIFEIDRYYGDRNITSAALLSLYGFSYIIGDENIKLASEQAMLSAVVSTVIVYGVKEAFGRSRPYRKDGHLHFKPFSFKESRRSLPSGHAAVTFAISTVFADKINNVFWKSFWYGGAVAVSAARIYKNDHWFSDVIAGGALGWFVAKKTQQLLKNKKATPYIGMALENNAVLLGLRYEF